MCEFCSLLGITDCFVLEIQLKRPAGQSGTNTEIYDVKGRFRSPAVNLLVMIDTHLLPICRVGRIDIQLLVIFGE